ncbi:hypothetical protein KP509_34G073500 [Ceratopteris richardii]|uniref:Uncharacterized protein n=1 Tax=Ceratopteris richardii TaxID=49495 RepID=A0A8T2QLD4_CERRI|nr:hypothetical protein KP509_34G073500 [Ceratopteris richardii]KAH7284847.1 hypothetical protein KP509_34G073500 [Ceratopteris richardii]
MAHGIRSRLYLWNDTGNREIVCPRPQYPGGRFTDGSIQIYKFSRKLASSARLPPVGEPGREILDILSDEACLAEVGGPIDFSSLSLGSPPVRSNNPVIHDVRFKQEGHRALPILPQNHTSRLAGSSVYKKSSYGTVCGSKPYVRIEGFALSKPDARGVPAIA